MRGCSVGVETRLSVEGGERKWLVKKWTKKGYLEQGRNGRVIEGAERLV